MAALKVSLEFLEGPVPQIISKCNHIAKSMTDNDYYRLSPISAGGLHTSVTELEAMEKKNKTSKGKFSAERDMALLDVTDFVQQIAPYVEHACKNNLEIFLTSGFDQKVN